MNPVLFYDTETSGLPLFDQPSEDPRQPHLVQLGACLVDLDTRRTLSTMDVMVRPDGWTIPDEVAAVHGITTEMASDLGVPEPIAVSMLLDLWAAGRRLRIAHNEPFDARILRIALKRYRDDETADAWKAGGARCTQLLSTPILKLPPTEKMKAARRFHHKSANLGEAYQHFMGKPLQGAHSALVDVHGCMEVFFAIQDLEQQAAAA
ncbi:3'-5' exonuclease [Piscinibacter sakaiensis]|uniref:DNA polymerase III, alpha subunit n=1 Tax=Piscinibacter sakaiensis TaxID=1547922 RepID=A0A0K8P3Z9_PISS1|nr:3'-5' exonuclease [Piscinibacter sakaiensis]GAP37342.1 DNA polymerase III, alpha subunit [Piscinibacter sakaiensis]